MEEEIWKPVVGYEGRYEVSNLGRVKSLPNQTYHGTRILKPHTPKGGYPGVVFLDAISRRRCYHNVHALVARAFHGPPPAGHEVCHRDGDRSNPKASNLMWGTPKVNSSHMVGHGTLEEGEGNGMSEITRGDVVYIDWLRTKGFSHQRIGDKLGITGENVSFILKRVTWKFVPKIDVTELAALEPGQNPRAFFLELVTSRFPSAGSSISRSRLAQLTS